MLKNLEGFKRPRDFYKMKEQQLITNYGTDMKKVYDKLLDFKQIDVKNIIFDPVIQKLELKNKGMKQITDFFNFT